MTTIVHDNHYRMTREDFTAGTIVTDVATGKEIMSGTTRLGTHMVTILNAPLCCGCDAPVPEDGVCHGCGVVHEDIAERIAPARHVFTDRARLGRAA